MSNPSRLSLEAIELAQQTPLPWARGKRRAAMIARRTLEESTKVVRPSVLKRECA